MSHTAIASGTPEFKRINRAMAFGGFSTFALLYSVQPLMPLLAHDFALTPAQSSLALSASTATLAIALLFSSLVSDRFGRKSLMVASMFSGAVLTLLSAFTDGFGQLLALRALLGFMFGGMPAVAMAYLSEEIEPKSLGVAMGMYISGSAFGGMSGRVLASVMSDFWSWRVALAALGVAGLYAAWEFRRSLPESRNFRPGQKGGLTGLVDGVRQHMLDAGLPWFFTLSFLLMGSFVSLYNYIGYRLLDEPFGMRQSVVGALSILYLLGIFSSVWAGRLADRFGRRNVLWLVMMVMLAGLLITLSGSMAAIILGMGLATFGFFASHSVCSSWVGRRARPPQALASALYLFFYYLGSSVVGWVTGVVWAHALWPGVIALLGATLVVAMLIALRLRGLAPLEPAAVTPVDVQLSALDEIKLAPIEEAIMLQNAEIQQRFSHLQQTLGEAEKAAHTPDAPTEVRDCIDKLWREYKQAQPIIKSNDQQRITECVDNLEAMGDEAKRLSRSLSNMPAHLESVVTRVHAELSEFKHKLH